MAYKGGIKVKSRHPILKAGLITVLSLVCAAMEPMFQRLLMMKPKILKVEMTIAVKAKKTI